MRDDWTVDDHHRRGRAGGRLNAEQIKARVGNGREGRDEYGQIRGLPARHDQAGSDLPQRRRREGRRERIEEPAVVVPAGREHRSNPRIGGRDHGQTIGQAFLVEAINRLLQGRGTVNLQVIETLPQWTQIRRTAAR
jgi:hypothetical protein